MSSNRGPGARGDQAQASVRGPRPESSEGRTSPGQFLREVRAEMKKVAWPTREEVINYSIVVLVVSLLLTLFVAGLDWVIREATTNFFG